MKNLYLVVLFLFSSLTIGFGQTTWDNFEDSRFGTYDFVSGTFIPYNLNPDRSGANTSQVAAEYTRNPGDAFDVIIIDAEMADLSDYVSGAKQISIDVWSPTAGTTIQITLENSTLAQPDNFPVGRHSVYLTQTTVTNAWETLTFTFDNQPDASVANDNVDRLIILFDPDSNTSDTYYWDNLMGPEFATDPCDPLPPTFGNLADFECNQNVNFTFSHSTINFRRVINPDPVFNPTEYCATYTRNGGEEFDVIVGYFQTPFTVESDTEFALDVWDPAAPTTVQITLQFEDANGTTTDVEILTDDTESSSEWDVLDYTPDAAVGATVNKVVILFDPGTFTSDQYYFDNFDYTGDLVINTEEEQPVLSTISSYPNPTSGNSTFEYQLTKGGDVTLSILDHLGRELQVLVNEEQPAGEYRFDWNNNSYPAGVYFYSLTVDGVSTTGKIVKL